MAGCVTGGREHVFRYVKIWLPGDQFMLLKVDLDSRVDPKLVEESLVGRFTDGGVEVVNFEWLAEAVGRKIELQTTLDCWPTVEEYCRAGGILYTVGFQN